MKMRALPFEEIDNFRDYGGYPVAAGGSLRMGRLYRSGHHGDATNKDIALLSSLAIGAIIDLRSPAERTMAPSRRPENFSASIYEVESDVGNLVNDMAAAFRDVSVAQVRELFSQAYAHLATKPEIIAGFRFLFQAVAALEAPTVIHCSAGKDRTGIGVALLHRALGVHADDVMQDYLLTDRLGDISRRRELNSVKIRQMLGADLPDQIVGQMVGVAPEYLRGAMTAIEAAPGGMERFLREELGVDGAWRKNVERRLFT